MDEWIHPAEILNRSLANDADKRRYREKMKLLGYNEDSFCHLEQNGAHSSGELAGWDGFAQNCVCLGSPSSSAFLGREACFVTLTRYLILFH